MQRPTELVRSILVGRPKETWRLEHERISKTVGLAVFASDNLSSAAYATEEMLVVLVAGGLAAVRYSIPIAMTLIAVVAVIAFSYRGTIVAYPQGGGAYNVAHENLGKYPGLVAGAALLIDYILTVSVSVSAGVAAIVSFAPGLDRYRVPFCLAVILFMTVMNLRGVKEAGTLFAVPTYAFIVLVGGTIVVGIVKYYVTGIEVGPAHLGKPTQHLTLMLLLTAFARGSAAVTGIEAIANGVPSFRDPAPQNASKTLVAMASLLAFLFFGVTFLSHLFHVFEPTKTRTVVGLIAHGVWGGGPIFILVLGSTALILFLAANTSYAGFPALSAVLARDRYWPRQFMNRGDRLAYSNGIIGLAVLAAVLVVIFDADVSRLINLYVMGVFTALTLSQSGMVRHWRRYRASEPRWRRYLIANAVGGVSTFLVLCIVLITRFTHGGYMVVIAVPVLVAGMNRIHKHYLEVGQQLRDPSRRPTGSEKNHVVLLVGSPSAEEARAFWYAERIRTEDFRTVHFTERGDPKNLEAQWTRRIGLLPTSPALEIVQSQGSLAGSVRSYIERLRNRVGPNDFVTIILSEHVKHHAIYSFGTRTSLLLKIALLYTPGVVVTDVPYLHGAPQTALEPGADVRHVVVVLIAAAHNATLHALEYAKTLSADEVRTVHVTLDPNVADHHREQWDALRTGFELECIESPHRRLGGTVRQYIRELSQDQETLVTVVVPEFVVPKWWQRMLHNGNAFDIKWTLLAEPNVIVTSVPYHLQTDATGTAMPVVAPT